jgi:hypothetical protein
LEAISSPGASFRAKVQAGLAAQEVARRAGNTALEPVAMQLLGDPLPSVNLVGMKAASGLIPVIFAKAKPDASDKKLLDQVLKTVEHNPDPPMGGPIIVEMYDALKNVVFPPPGAAAGSINTDLLVPMVLKLQKQRIGLYKTGLPASPHADSIGVVILFSRQIWQVLTVPQQHEALQDAQDLITLAAGLAQQAKNSNNQVASGDLIDNLQTIGRDIRSIFANPANGVVPNQVLFLAMQKLASLGQGSGSTAIGDAATSAVNGLQAFGETVQ